MFCKTSTSKCKERGARWNVVPDIYEPMTSGMYWIKLLNIGEFGVNKIERDCLQKNFWTFSSYFLLSLVRCVNNQVQVYSHQFSAILSYDVFSMFS